MRKETRYEMILNHILDVFPQDKNLVLIDVYDNETGVVYAIGRPMFRKDYIDYNIKPKSLEPFIRVSSNLILEKEYYSYFSRSEQGDIFKIFRSVDGFGRIKYGENYQQYCRKEEVLATAGALRRGRADNEMGTEERLIEMGYRQDYNSMVVTYDSLERGIKEIIFLT